jgi:hypothetical protein
MGVWGQRPQQAEAYAEGKGSEHVSDPCRRHGQKLVKNIKQADPKRRFWLSQHPKRLNCVSSLRLYKRSEKGGHSKREIW